MCRAILCFSHGFGNELSFANIEPQQLESWIGFVTRASGAYPSTESGSKECDLMASKKDKKKKEREKRVAKQKLQEAARLREIRKAAAEKEAGSSTMSKKVASDVAAKTKFEESTKPPRKLGG